MASIINPITFKKLEQNKKNIAAKTITAGPGVVQPKETGTVNTGAGSQTVGAGVNGTIGPGGYVGSIDYGKTDAGGRQAIVDNQQKISSDPTFVQNEVTRTKAKIADMEARGEDASAQKKYLNVNLGYKEPEILADTSTDKAQNPPTEEEKLDPNAVISEDVMAELERIKQEVLGNIENSGRTAQQQVDANNRGLTETVRGLNEQKRVNEQDITTLQNRRGGFYSGGLDYQMGNNTRTFAQAEGDIRREVESRNANIWANHADLARQAQDKISLLMQQAPGKIRELMMQQEDKEYDRSIELGQIGGTILTPEMKGLYEIVLQAKDEYAAATTPEARESARRKAENARFELAMLGANTDVVGSNVTRQQAGASGSRYGIDTLAKNEIDWARDPNNPEVQRIQQDLAIGKIDEETARLQLAELQDPNSVTNQLKALGVEAAKLGNEELRKRIAEIGKMPVLTENEQRMQRLEIERAQIELDNLRTGGSGKVLTAKDMAPYFDDIVQRNENGQITNEDTVKNAIVNSDLSDYEAYQLYNRYGFTWDGEVPGK